MEHMELDIHTHPPDYDVEYEVALTILAGFQVTSPEGVRCQYVGPAPRGVGGSTALQISPTQGVAIVSEWVLLMARYDVWMGELEGFQFGDWRSRIFNVDWPEGAFLPVTEPVEAES